jgi:hypothetical protein
LHPICDTWLIRSAKLSDLDQLTGIEKRCFQTDLISRRQWRYLLTRSHADILLSEDDEELNSYVMVLYSQATSVAYLYPISGSLG